SHNTSFLRKIEIPSIGPGSPTSSAISQKKPLISELRKIISNFISRYEWLYLSGLVSITFILGYTGFEKLAEKQNSYSSPSTNFYNVLKLFILDYDFDTRIPWELEVARFLAPAFLVYAGFKAFLLVFQENIQMLRLRFYRNHVVICGLGDKGYYLAQDFIENNYKVVIIENNPQNDYLRLIQKVTLVLIGEATDKSLLQKARVYHADTIVVVTGDDGVNVEIAVHTYHLVNSLRSQNDGIETKKVKCFVHLVDLHLRTILKKHTIFTNPYDIFELIFFNSFENAARLVFRNYPIDKLTSRDSSSDQIHLVIIGLGQMGQSILVQASKLCCTAIPTRPCITVIDREAELKVNAFKRYNPHFTKVFDLQYENLDILTPKLSQAQFWENKGTPPISLFIICVDDDVTGLTTALTLLQRCALDNKRIPILVRMGDYAGLATLLHEYDFVKNNPIYPFGMTREIISQEILINESLDALAKILRREEEPDEITTFLPSEVDVKIDSWSDLPEDMKESTRHQADHMEIQLRNIDCIVERVESRTVRIYQLTSKEVEELAQLEHTRWMSERYLDGWTYAQGDTDIKRKTSPFLVPWDELPEDRQEMNRENVRKIPQMLANYNLEIHKIAPYIRPRGLSPIIEHLSFYKGAKSDILSFSYLITSNQLILPEPIGKNAKPNEWINEYKEYFTKLTQDPIIRAWINFRLNVLINGPQSLQNFCLIDALIIVPPMEIVFTPLFETLSQYGKAGIFGQKGSGKSLLLLYLAHKWIIKYETPVLYVEHPHILTKTDLERLETSLSELTEIYGYEKRWLVIFENTHQITVKQLERLQRILSLTSGMPLSIIFSFTTEEPLDVFSIKSLGSGQGKLINRLISMIQTPKLEEYSQFSSIWEKWRIFFVEWVSLISSLIYDVNLNKTILQESLSKQSISTDTPLYYVSKETDFSNIIKAKKWKKEGNYDRIINLMKINDTVMDLNWILIDAYLEINDKSKAQEALEYLQNKLVLPLDTAYWDYYYGRTMYLFQDFTKAEQHLQKAVNDLTNLNYPQLYQEANEWLSKTIKEYLQYDAVI
ncbi:MAG: NAD-binding protein, partial [Candidatus Hodarchaeota archaeon]